MKTQQAQDPRVEYVVSGSWSLKAAGEAKRLGGCDVNIVVDGRTASPSSGAAKKAFGEDALPPSEGWAWSTPNDPKPAYIYYCSNETVNGVEIAPPTVPSHLADVPLVSDMSSNILSRPIPWDAHNWGLIYAGAQKNIGPAGLTIVIVRKDLVVDPDEAVPFGGARVPAMLSYKSHADAGSLYNTPPMFPIYVAGLVFKHLKELGGVDKIEELNTMKAAAVYRAVDESNGFYVPRVQETLRSRMNVVFAVPGEGRETRFIAEAEKAGIKSPSPTARRGTTKRGRVSPCCALSVALLSSFYVLQSWTDTRSACPLGVQLCIRPLARLYISRTNLNQPLHVWLRSRRSSCFLCLAWLISPTCVGVGPAVPVLPAVADRAHEPRPAFPPIPHLTRFASLYPAQSCKGRYQRVRECAPCSDPRSTYPVRLLSAVAMWCCRAALLLQTSLSEQLRPHPWDGDVSPRELHLELDKARDTRKGRVR